VAWSVLQGVHIMRVHDVAPTVDLIRVLTAIMRAG
jgi:dihydropteroate synthase